VVTDSLSQSGRLPPYLLRYPHWGGLEHRWQKGRENLQAAVARHRFGYASLSFNELLEAVNRLDHQPPGGASVLVGEIIDRLHTLVLDDVERLVGALFDIQERDLPRRSRLLVDHAMQRLLFLLDAPGTHDLAFACACSDRALRRQAAYKFYAQHGLDEQARRLLVLQFSTGSLEEPKLIAKDSALVHELGLAAVLVIEPTTHLRKEAIETAMATLAPEVVAVICEDYPQELMWAVFDQRRSDYVEIILGMVDDYRDDPYLLHRVIDCIGRIGGPAELEYALHIAATTIDSEIPEQWEAYDEMARSSRYPAGSWAAMSVPLNAE
jgi:hypothetical protein